MQEDLPGHADEVYAVDWSPGADAVASGGKDHVLKMYSFFALRNLNYSSCLIAQLIFADGEREANASSCLVPVHSSIPFVPYTVLYVVHACQ